jgi:adenine-specific DNA-methyltransferase
MNLDSSYLTQGVIAYIGNKRALKNFLSEIFLLMAPDGGSFLDPFAGSGFVSRLARFMGFTVTANDWEPYAYILNQAALEIDGSDEFFHDKGGINEVIRYLNSFYGKTCAEPYISLHYAPQTLEGADYRKERLFYTPDNAAFFDNVRNEIELLYPVCRSRREELEKNYLLAMLLVQASVRSNTSGVFKACHKGFGGLNSDALSRIMSPALLEPFPLVNAVKGKAFQLDAYDFCRKLSADLCYLDPPYNIHQYGSNYFMLNTLVLWDKPIIDNSRDEAGCLKVKSGIRRDWQERRSNFCSRQKALPEFKKLIGAIDAQTILLSYNTEGVINFDELYEILSERGETTFYSQNHVSFRGGKQSPIKKRHSVEFVLVCKTNRKRTSRSDRLIKRKLAEKEFYSLLIKSYDPEKLRENFTVSDDSIIINKRFVIRQRFWYQLFLDKDELSSLSLKELNDTILRLKQSVIIDNEHEIKVLISIIEKERNRSELYNALSRALKKFAFKKYKMLFYKYYQLIDGFTQSNSEKWGAMQSRLKDLERLTRLRINS